MREVYSKDKIDISNLTSGNYILVAFDDQNKILSQQKFIKI